MINYSIIIPHKNSPDLLQKCLDSIPVRPDVQVVVVDDNSDSNKVDFDHFPKWKGEHYEYYLTKEGRGAGYARNVALEHAVGNWIVFSDADDFFLPELSRAMDDCIEKKSDIIFLKCCCQHAYTGAPGHRFWGYNDDVDAANRTGDFSILLQNTSPVMKFFRREIIVSNNIRFQEVRWGNDVYFYAKYVACSSKYETYDCVIYCVTEGASLLASCQSVEVLRVRLNVEIESIRLLIPRLDTSFSMFWIYRRWWSIWQRNKLSAIFLWPKMVFLTKGRILPPFVKGFPVDIYNSNSCFKKLVHFFRRKLYA